MSHYKIPDDGRKRVINFSGGRSSGYLLFHILKAHKGSLPDSCAVIFCNTGKEKIETLDFIDKCDKEWGANVRWLEYDYRESARGGTKDPKNIHKVVSYSTAARNGEPFVTLIKKSSMLPNVTIRKCTSELKVSTADRFCRRDLGWRHKLNILGIRYDEPRRWTKAVRENRQGGKCRVEYPLVKSGVTLEEVDKFWSGHSFDLKIPSRKSNCDLCFLKGKAKLIQLIREDPASADWWIRMEEETLKAFGSRLRKKSIARFSKRYSYKDLLEIAESNPALPFPDTDEEDTGVSCFCGD